MDAINYSKNITEISIISNVKNILISYTYNMKKKSWTKDDLVNAVAISYSKRQVLLYLGLIPAGGNYEQVKKYIKLYGIDTAHFKGKGWNKGMKGRYMPLVKTKDILVKNSDFQSFKLKKRLFIEKIKFPECEECGWAKKSEDGRIPVELDHINGDRYDNRLENLRILCPNCHSLKSTHRGKNKNKLGWRNR